MTEERAASSDQPQDGNERTPLSTAERAEQIRVARERATAARAARQGGKPPPEAQLAAVAQPEAASGANEAMPPAARAAPIGPEERAAAIEAARAKAAAARAVREGGTPAPAASDLPAARSAMEPEERAAAVAQAQARAAALRAERTASRTGGAAVATASVEAPSWRIGPGGIASPIASARPEPHAQEVATAGPIQRAVLRRRELLRGGFWAGVAVLLVGGLASTLDLMNPRDIHGFGGVVTIPAVDVPKPGDAPYHYLEGKTWLVNLKPGEGVPEPFYSVAPPSKHGGLLAIYHKCPHLGCTVPWRSDFVFGGVTGWFRCPCHGSTYTQGGVRVFGPAPRSMDTFKITKIDQTGVSVDTGKITLGALNDPQRALPPGPYA